MRALLASRALLSAGLAAGLGLAAPALGQAASDPQATGNAPASETGPGDSAGATPAPEAPGASVGLDQLLTLPTGRQYSVERKGGLTRGEWRARYAEVRGELAKEHAALDAAESKLDGATGGQWKVNPIPGADTSQSQDAPVDFSLRSELRRHRDEVERLERKLRQLDIEANLAAVPPEWRQ